MNIPAAETPWQSEFPQLPNFSENYCLANSQFKPRPAVEAVSDNAFSGMPQIGRACSVAPVCT
jgi:hypothetical protein